DTQPNPTSIYVNLDDDGLFPGSFRPTATIVTTTNVVTGVNTGMAIPAQKKRGITPQVNIAWDRSTRDFTQQRARIYLVYTDVSPPNSANTDIYLSYSDDVGLTWSAPTLVNDFFPGSQFLPTIAVDQTTGYVAVVWL